jgi:5-formyltetrahydrofolate cyclo-ligase
MISTALLRETIRTLRRATPQAERHRAARQLVNRVMSLRLFTSAKHIAGYLAFDGEIDPAPLLQRALEMGKQVYLPILAGNPQEHLVFAPYRSDTKLKPNRFGIPEPQIGNEELLTPQYLDLVLTPLVAFDASGTRLGMGGGFYDRTFAFLNHPGHFSKPRLFGLAYELQRVDHLPRQPWDVPLQGIITERAFYSNGDNCVSK